jgi:NDP-4-keto-2,6-dideoxyhexose 3-C-methyltransferase
LIKNCRSCKSTQLFEVVNLGMQYLSDFREDSSKPEMFPLKLLLCETCNLAQLDTTVDRELMYHDGYGYRSGVNEIIVNNLTRIVNLALAINPHPTSWLDIACNDGTLLSLVPKEINRVGVDPVRKFKAESNKHADLIISDFFPSSETDNLNEFDVITSISMFYDIDDPNSFVQNVKSKLSKNGIWIVQQNYLLSMLMNNSFDNICHEHIEYYSLKAMNYLIDANGLEIFDVKLDEINGGSVITLIAHKGSYPISRTVAQQLQVEENYGLSSDQPFLDFKSRIDSIKSRLLDILQDLKCEKKRVQIYGASTRGATIWQYVGVDEQLVEHAVERQQEKIGKYFSAVGVKIIGENQMRNDAPDYLLVGPWFLKDGFIEREREFLENGGKFIFPLPEVQIIQSN